MLLRTMILAPVIAAIGLLSGCGTPFVHSASSVGPAIQDPGLVGEWATTGPTATRATIKEPSGGQYAVALTVHHEGDAKTTLSLDLSLTQIGGARYADLFLARAERDKLVGTYGFLAVPVHQIMKVAREGDELRVWSFNGSWLEGAVRGGMFAHDRVIVGGGEVAMVTAPTDQVRELIARLGDDPKAFDAPMVFRRVGR